MRWAFVLQVDPTGGNPIPRREEEICIYPLVSVVIPFYNCPYVAQAVESVLAQTYPNIELIVVDDGSTSHAEQLAPYAGRLTYLGKANGGTASALNHGMRMASGKYVAWLSADDRFEPTKIARQVAHMEAYGARICHTNFHYINEYGAITATNQAIVFPTARDFIAAFLQYCPVNGCTVMMTKEIITGLNWFDESLPYTHDYDLWIRAVLSGIDLHFINEPLTHYRWHSGMGTMRHLNQVAVEAQAVRKRYAHLLTIKINSLP